MPGSAPCRQPGHAVCLPPAAVPFGLPAALRRGPVFLGRAFTG